MQRVNKIKVWRLPQLMMLSLLLAMALTFTACGGGDDVIEQDGVEEGIGDEGIGDDDLDDGELDD